MLVQTVAQFHADELTGDDRKAVVRHGSSALSRSRAKGMDYVAARFQ